MIVNGTQFDTDLANILAELKSELALNGIERFYKMFDSGDDIMVCCPYHKDGHERRPSAGIRKSDGLLHCLACGKTVGIDEMIANCFGYSDPAWGYRWLVRNFATVSVENRKAIELDLSRKSETPKVEPRFVSDEELDSYRYFHPYMYKRGLTDEIITRFDIGYDPKTTSITFPVRDKDGNCMFIARRSVNSKRFDIPKGIDKPLYGLFEVTRASYSDSVSAIYVCEGLFDCLRLWCNGRIAVAGFGCLFSDYQMRQLQQLPTRKLVLATDSDKAGIEARQRIRGSIKNKIITEVILPEGRKDIGECTDDEIRSLSEVF